MSAEDAGHRSGSAVGRRFTSAVRRRFTSAVGRRFSDAVGRRFTNAVGRRFSGAKIRQRIKRAVDLGCVLAVAAPAAMCAIEAAASETGDAVFSFWAQAFALLPGLPGVSLRRAFYRLTLDECAESFFIGFGALFSHRHSRIEQDAYVGPYAVVGSAWLRRGCLLGTRSSIVSGANLHSLDSEGRWTATDHRRIRQVEIGEYSWIGEGSIVMADIGPSAMVGAGSVVSNRIPARVVVVGNPARIARRLTTDAGEGSQGAA
jgi:acetyltransferase-like isoleucine patch superfamily enzyme